MHGTWFSNSQIQANPADNKCLVCIRKFVHLITNAFKKIFVNQIARGVMYHLSFSKKFLFLLVLIFQRDNIDLLFIRVQF